MLRISLSNNQKDWISLSNNQEDWISLSNNQGGMHGEQTHSLSVANWHILVGIPHSTWNATASVLPALFLSFPQSLESIIPIRSTDPAHIGNYKRWIIGQSWINAYIKAYSLNPNLNKLLLSEVMCDPTLANLGLFFEQGLGLGVFREMKVKKGSMGKAISPFDFQVWSLGADSLTGVGAMCDSR